MKSEIYDYIKKLADDLKHAKNEKDKTEALYWLLEAARAYEGDDKLISSLDIAEKLKNSPPEEKFLSGFKGLDDILDGFRRKQVVVISAATKSGKTSFCIDLTSRLKEKNPVWLPFEESAAELIQKFLDRNEQPPLFFTPEYMKGNTLTWVEKKIIEGKAKHNCSVVFIDHLHYLVKFGDNISHDIGEFMRELKQIAKRWDVVIFLIAHIKKAEMVIQPTVDELRDSSFVAQEADTVIMLWREAKRDNGEMVITNNVNVSVQANRRTGKTGNIKLVFDNGRFLEQAWSNKDEEELNEYVAKKW